MGDLKSLKLAAALVVVSLVAGMIHPDTRTGLVAGWRISMEQTLKGVDPDAASLEAKVIYNLGSFPAKNNSEALNWRSAAVAAAIQSDDLDLKGIAARASSMVASEPRPNQPVASAERIALTEARKRLVTQGSELDPNNAFWWLELATDSLSRGDTAAAENLVLRASSCSAYSDFGWVEIDVRRRVYQQLVGRATENEMVAESTAILFPHFASHRWVTRRLLVGRSFAETAKLRLALARLGLLMADDSQTLIGQLVGSSTHRLSLVKTFPGEMRIPRNPEYFTVAEAERLFAEAGHADDRSWRVVLDRKALSLPQGALTDLPPLVLFGPTMGYATTWRALLCGLLMAAGLWYARKWAESGWLGLLRPAFAVAPLFAYLLTLTGRSGGKGVPETIIALCLVSAGCLIYKRAQLLFPLIALALPQIIIQSGSARIEYILLGIFGSLLAIGGYLLAWKPDLKASKWMAPWFPLILLVLSIFAEMKVSGYVNFQPTNVYGEWPIKTMSEPTFTPVFFWSMGFTVLATLACLQKERLAALAQAKSVATFTAILVASSVLYTGVMETQSRDAIRQFKSETRYLEAQLGEALRKADYPSPAANNPAWKR